MNGNPYPFPCDDTESERLDTLHDMFRVLYHADVLAPIQDLRGTRIVDLGAGSGYFDNATNELTGRKMGNRCSRPLLQRSSVRSRHSPIPANLGPFELRVPCRGLDEGLGSRDISRWQYRFGTYEVHLPPYFLLIQRLVNAGVFETEWPGVMKEIYRMVKPGNGWIQCGEGGTPLVDPAVQPPELSYVWKVSIYVDDLVN